MERDAFAVTVAIPAYNEATRIAAAIASARAQSEPPAEILVVDDGSTDGTAEVARALGARVISQPNGGNSSARNRAIREAANPWIAFCDADDVLYPGKLEHARRAHEMRPDVDFLFTDYCMLVEGRITVPSTFALVPDFRQNVTERLSDGVVYFDRRALGRGLAGTSFVLPSTVMVRRALVLEHGVMFATDLPREPDYLVSEDIEWFLRLLKVSDALAIDRVLTEHRRHPGSVSDISGRVRYGEVKLGEIIAAAPNRYVAGAAAGFAFYRRRHIRESGTYYLHALHFGKAREKLREAQRIHFRIEDEFLATVAALAELPGGRWLSAVARGAWRRGVKPFLLRLRRTDAA